MGVITLSDYEKYTETTYTGAQKARVELLISAINDWVESYTGRVFGEAKTFTKKIDYDPVIFTPHIDIQDITSLKIGGVEMTNYKWEESGRIVLSLSGKSYAGNRRDYGKVEVTYVSQYGGDTVVPAMVQLAALQLVSDNAEKEGSQEVTQASTGGYSVSMGSSSGGGSGTSQSGSGLSINGSVAMTLNNYRIRRA